MRHFRQDRTARKVHRCTADAGIEGCAGRIRPGDRYQYSSLPPGTDLGNENWWHGKLCRACAAYYGQPVAEVG